MFVSSLFFENAEIAELIPPPGPVETSRIIITPEGNRVEPANLIPFFYPRSRSVVFQDFILLENLYLKISSKQLESGTPALQFQAYDRQPDESWPLQFFTDETLTTRVAPQFYLHSRKIDG